MGDYYKGFYRNRKKLVGSQDVVNTAINVHVLYVISSVHNSVTISISRTMYNVISISSVSLLFVLEVHVFITCYCLHIILQLYLTPKYFA